MSLNLKLPKQKVYVKNASILRRLLAFILDIFVLNLVVFFPFQSIFSNALGSYSSLSLSNISHFSEIIQLKIPGIIYTALFFIFLLSLFYFALLESLTKQTVGMMIMRIYAEDFEAKKVSFFRALIRHLFILPVFPFYILWLVEPLHLAFYNERFLEKITKTRTVEYTTAAQSYLLQDLKKP